MARIILLVGNGINNIKSEYTWANLVHDLIGFVEGTDQIRVSQKPFPLLYEEIVAHVVKRNVKRESDIKRFIADRIESFRPNKIHDQIIALGLKNILTTNYDYTLELAGGIAEQKTIRNHGVVPENLYSLFRCAVVGKSKVWHIHGERNVPSSIALGYEHYSGYLQRMRNYVVMGTEKAYKRQFESLESRLKKRAVTLDSWIDFFFTQDVYILGLALDFVEMHLWWLLTYRARRKYTQGLPIKNRITYFYPSTLESAIRDKLELLQASDVVPQAIPLRSNNWLQYYQRALDLIDQAK